MNASTGADIRPGIRGPDHPAMEAKILSVADVGGGHGEK